MLIHKERLTGTTASGSLTLTTKKFSGVWCTQVYVKPLTATTTYTIAITDHDNDEMFKEEAIQGKLDRQVNLLMREAYTVAITSASADEAFIVVLNVKEKS